MKKKSLETIFKALNEAQVPYIIVGGLAVIHHGYGRSTQDLDLVIQFDTNVMIRAFMALEEIGYQPAINIKAEDFANSTTRQTWIEKKGMKVLKFWSEAHAETPIDIFVEEPFAFTEEYQLAEELEASPSLLVKIVSYETLLEMKKKAGRPRDLADIDELNLIHNQPSSYDTEGDEACQD